MKFNEQGRARPLLRLLALCLLFSLALSACGADTDEGDDGITVTDALGYTVTVKEAPQRVAALLGSFADVWMLAGGELVAAANDAWEDFGLSLPGAISLGGAHSPSLEILVSSDPDLVIASAATASHVEMRDALVAMGITVLYFDVISFEDYLGMLEICTRLTGRHDLYTQNGLRLRDEIATIKAAAEGLSDSERRILLVRVSSTAVKAKGSEGTVLGEMLADLGCINIADNNAGLLEGLSPEAILLAEPYRIFAVAMGTDPARAEETLRTAILESPALSSLSAVREGRVHLMDKALFHMKPNARFSEAYGILYDTLTEE